MSKVAPHRLGDLLNFKRGYDLPANCRVKGEVPVISSGGVSGFHHEHKADGEGLVTGRYGTLGEVYYVSGKYWPHNTALYVTDFKGNCVRYLYYLLKLLGHTKTSDKSAVPGINRNDLHEVVVPAIKDTREQKKIAKVLSTLDAKIELNQRMNEELEGMAKLLYDYWFVQYDFPMSAAQAKALGKPHLTGHPYRASGGKMTYNETLKRDIPEGWTVNPLFKATAVQYGFPFSTNNFTTDITDMPVVRIRDILENSISIYTTEHVDEKYRLEPNDLVIGMDGNFHMNFWNKSGSYLNQRSVRIRAREDSSISSFQAYFELSPYIKAREKNVSRTTVGHLSDKDLKRLHLLQAHNSEQFSPRKTFDCLLSKIIQSRTEIQELAQLRDWLLPMLMNNQVRVT